MKASYRCSQTVVVIRSVPDSADVTVLGVSLGSLCSRLKVEESRRVRDPGLEP